MDSLCSYEADNSVVVIDYSIIVRHIVVIAILALWLWIWYCGVNDNIDCIH